MSLFDSDDLEHIHRARLFPLPLLSLTCKSSSGSARNRHRYKIDRMINIVTNRCLVTLNRLYHGSSSLVVSMPQPVLLSNNILNVSDKQSSTSSPSSPGSMCSTSQLRILSRVRAQCAAFVLKVRTWCHSEPARDIGTHAQNIDDVIMSLVFTDQDSGESKATDSSSALPVPSKQSMLEGEIPLAEWSSVPLPLKSTFSSEAASITMIRADRIALPQSLNIIPMVKVLPPSMAEIYSLPESPSLLRPQLEVDLLNQSSPVPRARILGPRPEYVKLIGRLLREGMINFTDSPRCINGVFAVNKDRDTDRLIIDAQPANRLFVDSPYVSLPNPSHLVQLLVPTDSELFIAKTDLSNFYHHLGLPEWMTPYFALPRLTEEELASIGIR